MATERGSAGTCEEENDNLTKAELCLRSELGSITDLKKRAHQEKSWPAHMTTTEVTASAICIFVHMTNDQTKCI